MNRVLLACIALALPSLGAAAPCDILPYANQCQGSNYWPAPAGWGPGYNSTTCQPDIPTTVPRIAGWYVPEAGYVPANVSFSDSPEGAIGIWCGAIGGVIGWHCDHIASPAFQVCWNHAPTACSAFSAGKGEICPPGTLPTNHVLNGWGNTTSLCWTTAGYTKPSNGVCTARWTSSAQTALQKDPLDPDCDANSCVFDGTCQLR